MESSFDAVADSAPAEFVIQLTPAVRIASQGRGRYWRGSGRWNGAADGREIGQQRENFFVGEGLLRKGIHGAAQMPVPDDLESLLVGGEGECRSLPQVGGGGIKVCNIVPDVWGQLWGQLPLVSIDTMAGGAEALAIEDRSALFRILWPVVGLGLGRRGGPQ